jgi:hypothetical protein
MALHSTVVRTSAIRKAAVRTALPGRSSVSTEHRGSYTLVIEHRTGDADSLRDVAVVTFARRQLGQPSSAVVNERAM